MNGFMSSWSQPPDNLALLGASVHVWAVRLDDTRVDLERGREWLSPDERERALHFRFERHRRRYLVAHIALHEILGDSLAIKPAHLSFDVGLHGKPKLCQWLAPSGIEFNLSHSHELALIAVCHGRAVGVDVEHVREEFEFKEVAERFFTAKEVAAMRGLPSTLQRQAFFKCWTSKEAFLKAKGTGLSGALDEVEVRLIGDNQIRIAADVPNWWLLDVGQLDGYEAALVVEKPPVPVRCYQWAPRSWP